MYSYTAMQRVVHWVIASYDSPPTLCPDWSVVFQDCALIGGQSYVWVESPGGN